MIPEEIQEIRKRQTQDWLRNGTITPEQLEEIRKIWENEE